jgi:feruloyl-CoA synthase
MTAPTLVPHDVRTEARPDGTLILTSGVPLGPVVREAGEWLHHWAAETPDAVLLAEREGDGWREVTYARALDLVRRMAGGLLGMGVTPGDRMLILSGNGVDHALMVLAANYVGIVAIPVAEQYSLIPAAHDRLTYIAGKTSPALIFAVDAGPYGAALMLDALKDIPAIVSRTETAPRAVTPIADLMAAEAGSAVDAAHAQVGPETLAKILFTSGSTSMPKGVCTTQGMMCVNQAQLAASLPFLTEGAPKIVDWLPWNHVFGGSHNFNMMLANGGALYIDDGKPMKGPFARTLENLRMHTGTCAFNVPVGWKLLMEAMQADDSLRKRFFDGLQMIFYAGASLPPDVWTGLEDLAQKDGGSLPLMTSSWGMTETAPATLIVHEPLGVSGAIGVPVPAAKIKLVPSEDGRYELRVGGPNIMTAYYEDPAKTAEAFDDEGYLITGDAVKFLDPDDMNKGVLFDGRISEDFKLMSGTWVQSAKIRAAALGALGPIAQDVVVTGANLGDIGLLIFANPDGLSAAGIAPEASGGALSGEALSARIHATLAELAKSATGSSTRIARALVLDGPPSVADHEITAKGNLNIRKVLDTRAALVDRLYDNDDPATITV